MAVGRTPGADIHSAIRTYIFDGMDEAVVMLALGENFLHEYIALLMALPHDNMLHRAHRLTHAVQSGAGWRGQRQAAAFWPEDCPL